jgi:hypothetical protein
MTIKKVKIKTTTTGTCKYQGGLRKSAGTTK